MKKYSRVCAYIDLDAIESNLEKEKARIANDTKMIVVIKTDAYGHGANPIARMLEDKSYIWGYAVATLEEAIALRKHKIKKPILVLGYIFPEQYEEMILNEIRATVFTYEMASQMSKTANRLNKKAFFHIKLDTGMGRIGFAVNEESANTIELISRLPHIIMEGMFTHFAKADMQDHSFTLKQYERFIWMKTHMKEKSIAISYYHCNNSAGIMEFPQFSQDLVRSGITTYGLYPSDEVDKTKLSLDPALSLISHITYVKKIDKGTSISYGATFVATDTMRVATIPVGYGDGYPRSLSNKGYVLINGKKARILGRICMDQFMVDVTDILEAKVGTPVTIIGMDGNEKITVEQLGELSGRFNYEFTCDINKRVPRVFLKNEKVVDEIFQIESF